MSKESAYNKGLASGVAAARKFLKEAQSSEQMLQTNTGMKFAIALNDFVKRATDGTSWRVVRAQFPQIDAKDKSKYYDVRFVMKLDIEKVKQAIVNPEGYEDEYDDDYQSMHDDESKVERFSKYDNVMIEITMGKGVEYMTTPTVVLSFEKRLGDKEVLAVEQIHTVTEETFNNVVVYLVEDFITGDDEDCLLIPQEAAERYGLLLNQV